MDGEIGNFTIIVTNGYINLSLNHGYTNQKLYKSIVTKGYINLSENMHYNNQLL